MMIVCYKIENAYRMLKEKFSFDRQRSALLTANQDKDISNNSRDPEQSLEHNIEVFYDICIQLCFMNTVRFGHIWLKATKIINTIRGHWANPI